ncbi:MAG: hypothetical protein ACODAD_13885 [Planctomycetota bacterium]
MRCAGGIHLSEVAKGERGKWPSRQYRDPIAAPFAAPQPKGTAMVSYARRRLLGEDGARYGTFHCSTRCVRCAFLCGRELLTGQDYLSGGWIYPGGKLPGASRPPARRTRGA